MSDCIFVNLVRIRSLLQINV